MLRQNKIPATLYGKLTLGCAILEATIVIILESIIARDFNSNGLNSGPGKGIPVYLVIFITGQVFQVALAWDAVSNPIFIFG